MSLISLFKANYFQIRKILCNISELMKHPNQLLSLNVLVTIWKQRNNSYNVQLLKFYKKNIL